MKIKGYELWLSAILSVILLIIVLPGAILAESSAAGGIQVLSDSGDGPLSTPTGLTAVPESDKQVKLSWTDNSYDETGFYIERRKSGDTAFKQIYKTGADATTYVDKSGLKALTEYDYRVCAYKKVTGNSAYTDVVSITTLSASPKPPKLTSPKNGATGLGLTPTLEWTAAEGAASYTLEIATDQKFKSILHSKKGLTANQYAVPCIADDPEAKNLEWNTPCYWRVSASGSDGSTSQPSSVSKFKTAIGTAPTALAATAEAYNQVSLTWNTTDYKVTGYDIERKKTTDPAFKQIGKTDAIAPAYMDKSGLKASTEYEYRVCAYNKDGKSLFSDVAVAATLSTPPRAPKLNWPKNGASGLSLTPTLEWTAPEGAAAYTLEIAQDQKFATKFDTQSGFTGTQYTIPEGKLGWNITCYWRVEASNSSGSPSSWSTVSKFKTAVVPLPEAVPGGLIAAAISDKQIDLSWSGNPTYASGICIERKINTDATYKQIASLADAAIVSYSDKTVKANTIYSYRVRAYNAGGYSGYSDAAPAITPTAIPALILPADGAQIKGAAPNLDWSSPPGWWKFRLQVSTGEDFSDTVIDKNMVAAYYEVLENELDPHTAYYWRVCATNNLGATSAWSKFRSFLTGEGVDMRSPTVKSKSPEDGAASVPVTTIVTVTFSEAISSATDWNSAFILKRGHTRIEGAVSYAGASRTAAFTPYADLSPGTVYTATLTTAVQDPSGNHLPQDFTWTFSTGEGVIVSISDYNAVSGGTLDVNLNISQVTGLNSYQIVLEYDPAVIEVREGEGDTIMGVTGGQIGSTVMPLTGWAFVRDEDGAAIPGKIVFFGYLPWLGSVTGEGYLAQVHFNVIGAAGQSSPLNFIARGVPGDILYLPCGLYDKDAKTIPCTFGNGAVVSY
jgi:hypothetical protein